jgi:hypothetical protein
VVTDMADIQSPKVHKFTLRMKHKNKIQKMYMVSGDSNSDLLVISLEDSKDGYKFEPFVLQENSIVTMVFLKEDGNVVTGQAEITGVNEIQYLIKGNEISFPGIVEAQVQVYGADSRLSSWDFSFNVKESLDDGDSVESTTEYHVLTELITDVLDLQAKDAIIEEAEALRKQNELGRQDAEAIRVSNELIRKEAENLRETAEASRISQESSRIASEQNRENAENLRVIAETNRNNAESLRENAETLREEAEALRKEAEVLREEAESLREATFINNESTRQSVFDNAESERNQIFTANEANRQSTFDANEANRQELPTKVSNLETGLSDLQEEVSQHKNDYVTYKDSNNLKVAKIEEQVGEIKDDLDDVQKYLAYVDIYDSDLISDVYGVEADFVNNKFTRLAGAVGKTPGADFDSINAFGGRKRCILTDDGVVLAYYGEPGYVETGKLTQVITIGEEENAVTYPVGTPVQVMVEQPKFYYKVVPLQLEPITDGIGYHLRKARYYISDTYKPGFKVHPAFVRNGVEVDKIYLSAYEGSIYDESAGTYLLADEQIADFNADKLSSIAYAKPASGLTKNLTRANTRKLAENRGAGWQQKDVLCASASQMLMMIEYAAFNMQSAIGLGVVNKPSGEGNESELTGATSNLGNASGMAAGTNGLVSISYRGEENFWGNINQWIDGLNVYIDPDTRKTDAYWAAEDFSDGTGSAPYKHVGFNLAPNTNGYVSAFGWSKECDFLFLPTETLGNSALPVGDRFYNTQTGWRVAHLGGTWNHGLTAGAFNWNVHYSSTTRNRYIGGWAVYVPQVS